MPSASLRNNKRRCLLKIEIFNHFLKKIEQKKYNFKLMPKNKISRFDFKLEHKCHYWIAFNILNQAGFQNKMKVFSQKWEIFLHFEDSITSVDDPHTLGLLEKMQPVTNPKIKERLERLMPKITEMVQEGLKKEQDKYEQKVKNSNDTTLKALETEINKKNREKNKKKRNEEIYKEYVRDLKKIDAIDERWEELMEQNAYYEAMERMMAREIRELDVGYKKNPITEKQSKFQAELKLIEENKKNAFLYIGTAYLNDSFGTFGNNQDCLLESTFRFNKKAKLINHSYVEYIKTN